MRATLVQNEKLFAWVAYSASALVASVAIAGWSINRASTDQRHTNRQICQAINRFDLVVTQTLNRARANLPKLAYFQAHPAELAAQETEIARQLKSFAPQIC